MIKEGKLRGFYSHKEKVVQEQQGIICHTWELKGVQWKEQVADLF